MGSRLLPRFDFERLDFGAKAGEYTFTIIVEVCEVKFKGRLDSCFWCETSTILVTDFV